MLKNLNKTKELHNIWLYPENKTFNTYLLEKYNVSWILTTSEWGYADYLGDWKYKAKPYKPSEYIEIFSDYDILELVFRSGNATVFRCNLY